MIWSSMLNQNIVTAEELTKYLHITDEKYGYICDEIRQFPMSVTRYYMSLIDPDDPDDPIRKMAVPSGQPLVFDGMLDTSGEKSNTKMKGIQHKYAQTVLVLTTADCAMYCRHCFRRRLVGIDADEIVADSQNVVEYVKAHPEVSNVLLTGGDSFMLPTEKIVEWLELLSDLDQLDFIRFGTRTPVTFPDRILTDPDLIEALAKYGKKKQLYVITHFNHPKEFTGQSRAAIRTLQEAGVVIKNQTVLMKGVNDDPHVLAQVLKEISGLGIVPHYIFQCRPVTGVKSRFQVSLREGAEIVRKANSMQNGLGKAADYTMSHPTGKIRILGFMEDGKFLFQYKQAKDPELIGRIFAREVRDESWLPDEPLL